MSIPDAETAHIEAGLSALAERARPLALEPVQLARSGRRRRDRRRASALLVAVACVGAVAIAGGQLLDNPSRPDVVAVDPAGSAPVPSEQALVEVAARTLPGFSLQGGAEQSPPAQLREGESLYAGHERLAGLLASLHRDLGGETVGVNWQLLRPGLDAEEVDVVLREIARSEPAFLAYPPVRLLDERAGTPSVQVLQAETGLLAAATSRDGALVVARLDAPPVAGPSPSPSPPSDEQVQLLASFVRVLAGGAALSPRPMATPPPARTPAPVADGIKAPPPQRLVRTDEFGTIASVRQGADGLTIEVDRVDMLGGAEGEAAARARGQDYSNDYFLVNDNPQLRTYRVDPDAPVWGSIVLARTAEPTRIPLSEWVSAVSGSNPVVGDTLFHLQLARGVVVGIEEQYRP